MGFANRAFVAAGVGFAASAIVGCGSSGGRWLSQSQATTLSGQLNLVTQALDAGNCSSAQRYLADFQNALSGFGSVNSTLVANLNQGASTIQSLTSTECATRTVTTPKKHPTKKRKSTTTTTTATQTIPTFTQTTTTTTYPTQTYTEPATSTTSTTGGVGPTGTTSTTASTTTSTTTPSGGTGLGGGSTDTTSTTDATSGATTTGSSGFGNSGSGF